MGLREGVTPTPPTPGMGQSPHKARPVGAVAKGTQPNKAAVQRKGRTEQSRA